MYTAGIDIGSITTKAAVIDENGIAGTKIILTGYNPSEAGRRVLDELLRECSLRSADLAAVVATGYGRNSADFGGKTLTEIICHGAGAHYLNPDVRSVVDVGGQDSKALVIDELGKTKDFAMNDKCAAGTGRFLEVMARALEVDLDEFGPLSLRSNQPSRISSICTVFAESEVISLIAKGEMREDIIAGIHESVAARVATLAHRAGVRPPLMMTGGVARNVGVVKALERKLEMPVEVSPRAQVNGAIGAAVLAMEGVSRK